MFAKAAMNSHKQTSDSSAVLYAPLRDWRNSAMELQMYDSALFWAKKLVSMTGSVDDVLFLAKLYYCQNEWIRAEKLLESSEVLGTVECRVLAAQVAVKLEKWNRVLEILENDNCNTKALGNGLKVQAVVLYLRGVAYSHLNKPKLAKACLIDSVQLDFRCFQAFEWIIKNNLLSVEEEQELIDSISFGKFASKFEDFSKLLFQNQKRQASWSSVQKEAKKLIVKYHLQNDPDIILAEAHDSFLRTDYETVLDQTTKLLDLDPFSPSILTLHIACLYELREENKLFLLAHQLVDSHPEEAIPWFAVGTFYLLTKKHHEARRYFSKASSINPMLGCAWIGFGHSFALEDESDQAIFAYSSASKIIKGHVPFMYIGMQHLKVGNYALSMEYLYLAYEICQQDPLLLQELGILHYNMEEYDNAITKFQAALTVISSCAKSLLRETILFNLGHAYRKQKMYQQAKNTFNDAMLINPTNPGIFAGLGIIAHTEKDLDTAIENYHKALNLEPDNPRYVELLDSVLEDLANIDPIKIIRPSYKIESKCKTLHKYFENEPDNFPSPYVTQKKRISPIKETTPRKLAGVRTRSQTKNMGSDPFTDPFVDNSPSRIQKSDLFISSFKGRLFGQSLEDSSSKNSSKKLDFFGIDSNGISQSGNSSFSFSPLGSNDPTPLFFPPAREPPSLSFLHRQIDSDDVEMEIDDV